MSGREQFTTVGLGCEVCPHRREIVIPGIGNLALIGLNVPMDVTSSFVAGLFIEKRFEPTIKFGSACRAPESDTCGVKDDIDSAYRRIASDPSILEAQLDEGSR